MNTLKLTQDQLDALFQTATRHVMEVCAVFYHYHDGDISGLEDEDQQAEMRRSALAAYGVDEDMQKAVNTQGAILMGVLEHTLTAALQPTGESDSGQSTAIIAPPGIVTPDKAH